MAMTKNAPKCQRTDCHFCVDNECQILIKRIEGCPFFKTDHQFQIDRQASYDRLMALPGGAKLFERVHMGENVKAKFENET